MKFNFNTGASVFSHNLPCAVSCPNIFVLNTNETVLPAAFTASSCENIYWGYTLVRG